MKKNSLIEERLLHLVYTKYSKSYARLFENLSKDLGTIKSGFEDSLTQCFSNERSNITSNLKSSARNMSSRSSATETTMVPDPSLPSEDQYNHGEKLETQAQVDQLMTRRAQKIQEDIQKILSSVWPQGEYGTFEAMEQKFDEHKNHRAIYADQAIGYARGYMRHLLDNLSNSP